MLFLTVGIQFAWLVMETLWGNSVPAHIIWSTAAVMPLIYVLAWAATTFSREHESGGLELLRALPTSSSAIWLGKLGFTLASSVLLGLAIAILTPLFAVAPAFNAMTLGRWGLWLLTMAGIGSLCSLWIKRPLTATFAAGGLLTLFALWPSNTSLSMEQHVAWLNRGWLFAIGLFSLALSYPLTRPWLQDRLRLSSGLRRGEWLSRDGLRQSLTLPQTQVGRLLWVTCRRDGWALMIFVTATLAALLLVPAIPVLKVLVFVALAASPLIVGVLVFACEQDPIHSRFLVGQGVTPGRLWWQRQFLGLCGLGIVVGLFVCWRVLELSWWGSDFSREQLAELGIACTCYVLVGYAVGQCVSITVRSPLVALAVAGLLATFVFGWAGICTALGIPWWIAVAIPVVGLLFASRLRAKLWLLEWNGWRDWIWPAATLVGTLAIVYACFFLFRVLQIPATGPGFDVDQFLSVARDRHNASAAERIDRVADQLAIREFPSRATRYVISHNNVIEGQQKAIPWSDVPQPFAPEAAETLEAHNDLLTPSLDEALEQADGLSSPARWTRFHNQRTTLLWQLASLYAVRASKSS